MRSSASVRGVRSDRGTTLVEVLVASALFVVLLLSIFDIFKTMLVVQRRVITNKLTQDSVRFAIEVISKEVRNSVATTTPNACQNMAVGDLFTGDATHLYLLNGNNNCVQYSLVNGDLVVRRYAPTGAPGSWVPLTSGDVTITALSFDIEDIAPASQGRVTLTLDFESSTQLAADRRNYKIQTTLSSRYYYE